MLTHYRTENTKGGKGTTLVQARCGRWVYDSLMVTSECSCERCAAAANGTKPPVKPRAPKAANPIDVPGEPAGKAKRPRTARAAADAGSAEASGHGAESKGVEFARDPTGLVGLVIRANINGLIHPRSPAGNYEGLVRAVKVKKGLLKSMTIQLNRNGKTFEGGRRIVGVRPEEVVTVFVKRPTETDVPGDLKVNRTKQATLDGWLSAKPKGKKSKKAADLPI